MRRVSRDLAGLESHYDAVVVGSGYGGGVAASRLARMGLKVAVLERGREFLTGEFPDSLHEAEAELQVTGEAGHTGRRLGLYDVRLGRDMHVVLGCGLGGTSLINANVSLPPDPRVWEDPAWPHDILTDDTLEEGFARAQRMLRPRPYPNKVRLDKLVRLGKSAEKLGVRLTLPPINVAFEAGPNAANVVQPACVLCGDCCSGCNTGAKSTVQVTYIADAVNHGAAIFTEASVRSVAKDGAGWRVNYRSATEGRDRFHTPDRSITGAIVVLAAGSLGSTEILLRSREQGLRISERIGQSFTGNGDVLAFAYNNDRPVNGVGTGVPSRVNVSPPGPCIAGAIDRRDAVHLRDGMIIEEGVIPSGLHSILPLLLSGAADLFGKDTDQGVADEVREKARRAESALLGAYYGAAHATQTFLVMANDDGRGSMALDHDRLEVSWPHAARQPIYDRISDSLLRATEATGGTYIRNPLQSTFLGKNLVTVHPLGGCPMGDARDLGVVNHKCQVFDGDPGADATAVHDGLYVCDGAVMSRPLGVNPLLTITAVAERAMIHLARHLGRTLQDAPKSDAPLRHAAPDRDVEDRSTGMEFTERMAGFVAEGGTDHGDAAELGRHANGAFSFTATILIDDVVRFTRDPDHTGQITGTAHCPMLSPEPLDIVDGVFNLMRRDEDRVDTRRFDYRMTLVAHDGRRFRMHGYKVVKDDPTRLDLWKDTTTLFVELAPMRDGHAGPEMRGVLVIDAADFARQMRTLKARGGANPAERLAAVGLFGALFAGTLFDVFGQVLSPERRFDPGKVRKKRELRTGAPEVHHFLTADGKRLRLTRYQGGDKGPLLFTHGLGVSSLIFSIDTIDTNLAEYMHAAGYDCWLLDYRASTDLPYATERWTADDVAAHDYQPAVDLILAVTERPSVQVMAHCFGATTFTMAMLSGLAGVRSAVISQISTDVVVPWWPQRLLAHLRLPTLFDSLGIGAVNARATRSDGAVNRMVDLLIRVFVPFQPEERTANATSNRITALYGQLYESDRLNRATFEHGLPEMFGEANIEAFKQLALIARKTRIVDAKGADTYLPNLELLAIPILFIHGEENACFKPESTSRTVARLAEANGVKLYERRVIPGYGHIDCIFGKTAAEDVFPWIRRHLDRTAYT